MHHELGVRVRKGKTNRFFASPQHSMPEAIAIKGYRRIKIADAKQKVIELSKRGAVGAHVAKHPRLNGVLAIRDSDHLFAAARIGPAPLACTIPASASPEAPLGSEKVSASPRQWPSRTSSRTTSLYGSVRPAFSPRGIVTSTVCGI